MLQQPEAGRFTVFAYEEGRGRVHHVGIYCGNGEMLHSPKRANRSRSYLLKVQFMKRAVCHQALF
ncbi:NlpC/P60 family protein [Bacillus licheniformis]|nr:NlpC/P60 family protein [Bacillus licheniformis]